jgi:hypothetical protein
MNQQVEYVLAMLRNGANRYIQDDSGNTMLKIAQSIANSTQSTINSSENSSPTANNPNQTIPTVPTSPTESTTSGSDQLVGPNSASAYEAKLVEKIERSLLHTILSADYTRKSLLEAIIEEDENLVAGLLLQGAEINYLDSHRSLLSPLIAATLTENIPLIKLLLIQQLTALPTPPTLAQSNSASGITGSPSQYTATTGNQMNPCSSIIDVNFANSHGETALLLCVKLSLLFPNNYVLVIIAAILIRSGANRYLYDNYHLSPVSLIKSIQSIEDYLFEEMFTAQEREVLVGKHSAIHYYRNDVVPYFWKKGAFQGDQSYLSGGGGFEHLLSSLLGTTFRQEDSALEKAERSALLTYLLHFFDHPDSTTSTSSSSSCPSIIMSPSSSPMISSPRALSSSSST